ncbi:IclR family transcriptional regulator [Ideonella paludis]|uniref:IclR family transcriptional regulator n=1 Tax=Ideonella paludis TaxID=1233411 RepID=A0ABS5E2E8_9BURK|nr:IclR family transcriptional regulator [Ideonella paludis]MBQ0937484.1 IclR family transcriptional regulator [Ideonella paludis]
MPRPSSAPSLADQHAAPGGVAAVDRALTLLLAFEQGESELSLTTLAQRTGLYKSTALRLIASLEHAGLLSKGNQGYRLGAAVARLHRHYTASFSLQDQVMPVLNDLVARTQESAAFHVRQGEQRLCLYRVDSPHPLRDHVRAGDLLPLNQGAGGRVLLAFSGQRGKLYADIRAAGVATLHGDRIDGLSGISAPVFGPAGELLGALTLTLPSTRWGPGLEAATLAAAQGLSHSLGGGEWGHPPNSA